MKSYSRAINDQYGSTDLVTKILKALENAGKDLHSLTLDDLAYFDQLHAGGRQATRTLAQTANLDHEMRVLDIGSGIGGSARTLAAEFGCQVVGLDLTETYCEVAEILTRKVGLADKITFKQGNALALPFADESFDAVWSQNTIMNIDDKWRMFAEAQRVLKLGGILAVEAVLLVSSSEIHYPVFWADHALVSFLVTLEEFRQLTFQAGFKECAWQDVTDRSVGSALAAPSQLSASLGLHLIYKNAAEKARNTMRCFKERRLIDIQAVYRRIG